MTSIDRRTLLYGFEIGSASLMLPARAAAKGRVAAAKPGENRFTFTSAGQAKASPCKVSSEDSGGVARCWSSTPCPALAHFCMFIIAKTNGITFFSANLFLGRTAMNSIFRRAVASGYLVASRMFGANTATTPGRLILMCQPGGFEKFFDEIGNVPMNKKSPDTMNEVMAKYGMEMLGPPIFASSWMQQHSRCLTSIVRRLWADCAKRNCYSEKQENTSTTLQYPGSGRDGSARSAVSPCRASRTIG